MSPDHHHNKAEQKGAHAMKRSNQQIVRARGARIAAGDDVFYYLVKYFVPEAAIAIAVSVEYRLAVRWKTEQEQMRARRDRHKVCEISVEGMANARKAFDSLSPGQSDERTEQYVIDLLAQFPADQAWWTAHRIKTEVEAWCQRKAMRSPQEVATAMAYA
jgi:hypothetical protein